MISENNRSAVHSAWLVSQFPSDTSAAHAPRLPTVAMCPLDSTALLSFTHRSFDLICLATIKFCLGYLFCLETYWTPLTEYIFCYSHGGRPPVVKQPWEFLREV